MKGSLSQLMQQAQKMQEHVQKAQAELGRLEVVGQAGGGMVKVTMTGRHEVRRVEIDSEILKDDPEMVEDLVAAATNDAVNRVAAETQERMSGLTGGMNLPPGFKLPF
ncbi:MAG: YbaB/EbfC family nucleoid-associated protein [Gammaproteobacteria bacterium]|nr:MAG: YbaB/EbfC family nucleoid-associated protein [Gammaproteobacteria bacterium]